MTIMDALVSITVLLLIWAVLRAWRGPIPPALMRPAHTLRMGVDNFHVTSQSSNGHRVTIEAGDEFFLSYLMIGDVVFITQPHDATQMFYVERIDHRRQFSLVHLIRDPE